MTTTTETEKKELSPLDRCDQCGGQAFVLAVGMAGELSFCGHHYSKIENNELAHKSLKDFAFEIVDDRYKLEEYEAKRIKLEE